jgi:hypothetical protein
VAQAGRLEDRPGLPILYRATQRARERFPGVDRLANEILRRSDVAHRGGDGAADGS